MRPRRRARRESSIEQSCVDAAHRDGWKSRKMNGLGFRDWPDRLFLPPRGALHATRFWVEFKKVGETSTDSQTIMQKDLRRRGETVHEDVDNLDDFRKILSHHS